MKEKTAEEIKDKVIRKFEDNRRNKYIIYRKSNGHYSLVKFNNGKGITVATTKATIFNYLKEMYKNNNLVEKM